MTVSVPNPLDAPVVAAYHLVRTIAESLEPALGVSATAVAIIAFTFAIRTLLLPLAISQARAEKARAALRPEVDRLRKKYARDPMRQQQEITALYRAEGTSMFAGCLPAMAQWPFFLVMYRLFTSATVAGTHNVLLTNTVLGQNLTGVLTVYGAFAWPSLLFAGLLVALTALAWWTSRRMAGMATAGGSDLPEGAAGTLGVLLRVMPYGTVVLAGFVPFAAGIYLLATTTWTAVERVALRRDLALAA